MNKMTFVHWIKRLRTEQDLTQEKLAEKIGCAVPTLRAFETGKRRPSRAMAEHVADVLGVPPEQRAEFLALARMPVESAVEPAAYDESTAPVAKARLPRASNVLIGREAECNVLTRLLQDEHCRFLNIVGAGGIGKTRLALEVATTLAPQFHDGAAFVSLVQVEAVQNVPTAILDVLGISMQGALDARARLLAELASQQMLLVLDNLEHLLPDEEDITAFVAEILRRASDVQILITSRERLRVSGECVFELGGLSVPNGGGAAEQSDSVMLFLERARQASGNFVLTAQNKPAVTRICQLVEGMPLGIELAAAWVRTLSPEEIAAEVEKNIDFLTFSQRDLPARHCSMRAVFDHSWNLLSEQERDVLAKMSIFQGGCRREAAEAVAGATLTTLADLIDKSLVRRAQGGTHARYDMHELVRQYACERLYASGKAEASHRAYIHCFLDQAEAATPHLFQADQITWFRQLDHELNNLRAVMNLALDYRDWESAVRIDWALWRFWWVRGEHCDSRRWMDEVIAAGGLVELTPQRQSQVELVIGSMAWASGDAQTGARHCQKAFDLCAQHDDKRTAAITLLMMGANDIGDGHYARARFYLEQCATLSEEIGELWAAGFAVGWSGLTHLAEGKIGEAIAYLERGLALAQQSGDRTTIHQMLHDLGFTLLANSEDQRAIGLLEEGLNMAAEIQDRSNTGYFIKGIAAIAMRQTASTRAVRLLGAAHEMLDRAAVPRVRHATQTLLYDQLVNQAQAALGHSVFKEALAEGCSLTVEQAQSEAYAFADCIAAQTDN
ncbi:MAG: helix-turn-helix domain-containing protein [Methanoregulaceae archaeon]|nr:helix-turn-helix domain-containing protein [Methanoregulaceae archaeon]